MVTRNGAASRLADLSRSLIRQDGVGGLRHRLVQGAGGTLVVRTAGIGLSFLAGLLLARSLGVAKFGTYAYAMTWIGLINLPAVAGLQNLIVRDTAAYQVREEWGLLQGLLRWSGRIALGFSVTLALLAGVIVSLAISHRDPTLMPTLWIGLVLVPLTALNQVRQAAIQGLRYVVVGQLPEFLVQPIFLIILVASAWLALGSRFGAPIAIGLNVCATTIAFVMGVLLLRALLPPAVRTAAPREERRSWLASAAPLLLFQLMNVFNQRISAILLGALSGTAPVGIYTVAMTGAELVSFVYVAGHTVISPTISHLNARGERDRLQRMITTSARVVFLLSLPIAIGLVVFGKWFLALFGPEFTTGMTSLTFLVVARLVNIGLGWNVISLIMLGYQGQAATSMVVTAAFHLTMASLAIPRWGLPGAAAAAAASMIVWNVLMTVQLYRKTGIDSTALGLPLLLRRHRSRGA